jgi:carbonic anhydrase/acetyltransferase-like protein (isoleucine patch superfamily)
MTMIRPYKDVTPRIAPDAYVDVSAQVIGDVGIGAESSVWMNAVVRGDVNRVRIGRRSNVQDGTIVHVMRDTHPTSIGDEVTIAHAALVHGCTIADRVLVGMGAILLNGVEIESDCIIAAGTLLPEGTRVPARSLVMGSPGKVRRVLTDEEVASIRWYADNYVRYRLEYMPRPRKVRKSVLPRNTRNSHLRKTRKGRGR